MVNSEALPLFEMGVGIGAIHQPYYVGTNQTREYAFPVPLPVYRGEVFKSDSRGVRAEVVDQARIKLDISGDFNLAIDSDDVDSRKGMEDIDSMLQVGPAMEIRLLNSDSHSVRMQLPVRFNLGVSASNLSDDGITFTPGLSYHHYFDWLDKPWSVNVAAIAQFGSEQYHDVYYSVAERFAIQDRPAYTTESGYSGHRITLSLRSRNRDRLWVWFFRYDNVKDAVFADSPLVETNEGFTFGLIYSKFLFRSKTLVDQQDR